MMKLTSKQVQHLLLRVGFGDSYDVIQSYTGKTPHEVLRDQFEKQFDPINVDTSNYLQLSDDDKSMMAKRKQTI